MNFLVLVCCVCMYVPSFAVTAESRVVVQTGGRLTLACGENDGQVTSRPVFVSWTCRGCRPSHVVDSTPDGRVALAELTRDRSILVHADQHRVSMDQRSLQLIIDPVIVADAGDYSCRVNNQSLAHFVAVAVQDVPGSPRRPLVTGFSSRSANISWAPSTNSRTTPVHHYLVQIKEGESGAWGVRTPIPTADNSTSFTVTGLRPYTVYSFRVLAENSLGRGAPSSPSYFMVTHRELPAVSPVIVSVRNLTQHSVEVAWSGTRPSQMNGEFLGYQLTYRALAPKDDTTTEHAEDVQWTTAELPAVNSTKYIIDRLKPYSRYRVRLQYLNMLGLGPPAEVDILTEEGEPGSPQQLSVTGIGDTWVQLDWQSPQEPGAFITGYFVYFETNSSERTSFTDVRVFNSTASHLSFNLTGLEPFSAYHTWTRSKSRRLEGGSSESVAFRTDVSGPPAPLVTNVTCADQRAAYVHWQRPLRVRGALDFYVVEFRAEGNAEFEQLVIPTSVDRETEAMFLSNLTAETMYEVRVSAGAHSVYDASRVYVGPASPLHDILVPLNCQQLRRQRQLQLLAATPWAPTPGVAAGLACSVAAVLLASLAYVMWRKYFQEAYNHLDEQNKTPSVLSTDWESDCPDGQAGPIPVHLFPQHVYQLHADGDVGYSREFEAIQTQTMLDAHSSDFSQEPENKTKNRYLNITAYDHTRVALQPLPGQKRCDYVNANFIDGYQRPRAYIGTQGPLPDTYDAFWRMVWEQDVNIIVMITNLIERGRKKCDLYWPHEGSETYGVITVTSAGEDVMATYTIRKFKLTYPKMKKSRRVTQKIVYQYHYTHWPDHGIPENPLPLLSFIRKSAAANRNSVSPIIVHCSAGVGRTGTYIVLDVMMQMIRTRGELNVFGFLKHIRSQRNYLVQTEDQYVFIHDALLVAIESGETDIHSSLLSGYLHNLQTTNQDAYPWYNLERQFKLITCDQPSEYAMTSALLPVNYHKNRSPELLPPEAHRVCLTPRAGLDGSDYINASWMMGFQRLQEFIITQHPLDSTVHSFWQMVWDHNVQTIVLLSPVNDQDFCIFWPLEHQDIRLENFSVHFTGEHLQGAFMIREFTVNSVADDYEMAVRIIQSSGWPMSCSPLGSVFDLVTAVQPWQVGYQQGPCVVVDRFGGSEAATFCVLTSLHKQLVYENHCDVFLYARTCHTQRPGVWRGQDDFLLLYRAVESLVSGGNTQSTVGRPPDILPHLMPPQLHHNSHQHQQYPQVMTHHTAHTAQKPVTPLKPILKNASSLQCGGYSPRAYSQPPPLPSCSSFSGGHVSRTSSTSTAIAGSVCVDFSQSTPANYVNA